MLSILSIPSLLRFFGPFNSNFSNLLIEFIQTNTQSTPSRSQRTTSIYLPLSSPILKTHPPTSHTQPHRTSYRLPTPPTTQKIADRPIRKRAAISIIPRPDVLKYGASPVVADESEQASRRMRKRDTRPRITTRANILVWPCSFRRGGRDSASIRCGTSSFVCNWAMSNCASTCESAISTQYECAGSTSSRS